MFLRCVKGGSNFENLKTHLQIEISFHFPTFSNSIRNCKFFPFLVLYLLELIGSYKSWIGSLFVLLLGFFCLQVCCSSPSGVIFFPPFLFGCCSSLVGFLFWEFFPPIEGQRRFSISVVEVDHDSECWK